MDKDEAIEEVGKAADSIDNLLHAMRMPLPASTHLQCVASSLGVMKETLRQAHIALSGNDPWASQPKGD